MLKTVKIKSWCGATGLILHHSARINCCLLPKRLFHQTISLYNEDDDELKKLLSGRKKSENENIYQKNNSRQFKYRTTKSVPMGKLSLSFQFVT